MKITLLCVIILLSSCQLPEEYYYYADSCHDSKTSGYRQEGNRVIKYGLECIEHEKKRNAKGLIMWPWLAFLII